MVEVQVSGYILPGATGHYSCLPFHLQIDGSENIVKPETCLNTSECLCCCLFHCKVVSSGALASPYLKYDVTTNWNGGKSYENKKISLALRYITINTPDNV